MLFVIDDDGAGLGRAQKLLTSDRQIVVLKSAASGDALTRAIEAVSDDAVDIVARHDAAGAALRLAAHFPEHVAAIVLESPPEAETYAALLPKLSMPVLVLYGTNDRTTSPDLGRGYKALLPNGWFLMVYNAGHDIAGDRPEAFADLVGDFLRRGVRFTISEQSSRINP